MLAHATLFIFPLFLIGCQASIKSCTSEHLKQDLIKEDLHNSLNKTTGLPSSELNEENREPDTNSQA